MLNTSHASATTDDASRLNNTSSLGHNSNVLPFTGNTAIPATCLPVIQAFVDVRDAKNAAEKAYPIARDAVLNLINGATENYVCGSYIIKITSVDPAEVAFTLRDGRKIKLSDIDGFTKGGKRVFAKEDIMKVFGGRDGYTLLTVKDAK